MQKLQTNLDFPPSMPHLVLSSHGEILAHLLAEIFSSKPLSL